MIATPPKNQKTMPGLGTAILGGILTGGNRPATIQSQTSNSEPAEQDNTQQLIVLAIIIVLIIAGGYLLTRKK